MRRQDSLHVLTVVGARPQFIKAAVVSRAIQALNDTGSSRLIREDIIHTGQHYDHGMSQVFFDEMNIPPPAENLAIGSGKHGVTTGTMMAGIERILEERRPHCLLVYGDTNSTLAGALAAAKIHVPVIHVEAGLRSFNRRMPEEINRVVTDHLSTMLLCPSQRSRQHLVQEGIIQGVHVVGDVMCDAVHYYLGNARCPSLRQPFALCTLHRAENTDAPERLKAILHALDSSPVPIFLPLHPRTKTFLDNHGISLPSRLIVEKPLPYFDMLGYLRDSRFVITDSGGLQKEAYFLGKRCITVRDETEWAELVEIGANRVVGADPEAIREAFQWALADLRVEPIYGSGDAGIRIANLLAQIDNR
jgi:UDP-GlcNAc3NAcA epimerase